MDHGGDQRAVGAVGLLLDQGCHDDDLLQTVGGVGDQRRQVRIVHNTVLKVGQQAAQGRVGVFLHIELIGIREQIALQAADAAQILVVHEVELVEHMVLGGLLQGGGVGHVVLRQQLDDRSTV